MISYYWHVTLFSSCRALHMLCRVFYFGCNPQVFSGELGRIFEQEMSVQVCTRTQMSTHPDVCSSRSLRDSLTTPWADHVWGQAMNPSIASLSPDFCWFPTEWSALNCWRLNSSDENGCALITGKFYIKGDDILRNALFAPALLSWQGWPNWK